MDEIKNKTEKDVKNIAKYIRKILKDAGEDTSSLGYQIELVATDIVVLRLLRSALFEQVTMTVSEKSREGDARLKSNPLLFDMREQSKLVQSGLDKLTMNIKSKKDKKDASDAFAKFMEEMKED